MSAVLLLSSVVLSREILAMPSTHATPAQPRQWSAGCGISSARPGLYLSKAKAWQKLQRDLGTECSAPPSPSSVASPRSRASDARAEEPYFKGKRLTLLIGSAPGGPTDIEGRLFAKYLARHIEGEPALVVQNKAGAGGLVGPAYLGEVAPRDGSMLGYFSGTAWTYVNEPERWRVDFKSFEFVAYQSGTTIHFMRTDVPPGMRVPADIVKAQGLIAGGLTVDNPKDLRLRLALDMLGVSYRYVTGYGSGSPARLALQRGEIQMFSESPPSYRAVVAPSLVKSGEVMPVWYDWGDASGDNADPKQVEGLAIPPFARLYRMVTGKVPEGTHWEAFRVIYEVSSTLQRVV